MEIHACRHGAGSVYYLGPADRKYRLGVAIHNETKVYDETSAVRGMSFENQFDSMEDVEKVDIPTVRLHKEAEEQIIAEAEDLFQGIIPFKMTGHTLHLGVWVSHHPVDGG